MLADIKKLEIDIIDENEVDFKNLEFLVETILSDIKKRKSKQNIKKKIKLKSKKINNKLIEKSLNLFV